MDEKRFEELCNQVGDIHEMLVDPDKGLYSRIRGVDERLVQHVNDDKAAFTKLDGSITKIESRWSFLKWVGSVTFVAVVGALVKLLVG